MKTRYHILIIIFIALSLYLLKDDVYSTWVKISSYLDKNNSIQVINSQEKEGEKELSGKVETPGPLRVISNYLINNDNIKLSKDNVINLTNKYRKENGNLLALKENKQLDLSAEKKLQDMFNKQYFEHISPSGVSVGDLGQEVGYEYILIGENLAMGNFKDDLALVDAWMASPGHRANILNKNYTDIGVAVGKGEFEGKSIWMAVQHFGSPRSNCPTVDQVLYGVITINQTKIKEMDADLTIRRDMINKGVIYQGSTYREQIDIYNNLVNTYNNLIKDTKEKVDSYNNQIRIFNSCLSSSIN